MRRCQSENLPILITQTYRDKEYQDDLYSQGRTKPGSIVTNSKGGQSMHNYRIAFDFCKNLKGHEFDDAIFFTKVGKIWRDMGGVWGGDWTKFIDKPHCEFTNGLTLTQLQKGITMPNETRMKWEENNMAEIKLDINGKKVTIPGDNINGTNMVKLKDLSVIIPNEVVPIRSIFEAAGYSVGWNGNTGTIELKK